MQAAKVWRWVTWLEIQPFWSYLEKFDNWNYTGNTFQIKNDFDFINSMYSTFIQQTSSNRRGRSWFLTHFDWYWLIFGILGVPDRARAYLNLELNPLIFRTPTGLSTAYSSGSNSELSINLYSQARIKWNVLGFYQMVAEITLVSNLKKSGWHNQTLNQK